MGALGDAAEKDASPKAQNGTANQGKAHPKGAPAPAQMGVAGWWMFGGSAQPMVRRNQGWLSLGKILPIVMHMLRPWRKR